MFITSGQEWAVSRKYLTFRWSLHIANSLSNTSVKVVCFSVLHQQAGGYHVTAFRSCIGVEPLRMISKSAHAGLHPQTQKSSSCDTIKVWGYRRRWWGWLSYAWETKVLWNGVRYKNSDDDYGISYHIFFFIFIFSFCLDIFIFCLVLPASKNVKVYQLYFVV